MSIKQPLTTGNKYFWCEACDLRLPLEAEKDYLKGCSLCAKCYEEGYRLKEAVIAYKPVSQPNLVKQEKARE